MASSREAYGYWTTGSHGGTYGGNALGTATAVATVETIRDEKLAENAAAMGERLTDGLMQGRYPVTVFRLRVDGGHSMTTGSPTKTSPRPYKKPASECNPPLLTCGSYENVIRWISLLVVNAQQIDEGLTVFEDALQAVSR